MRLHRLEVTAFGPFAGTETVDFDALAGAGLFLFTGATGAGKTSILDAVCFALYGQVPGARGTARGLRSDHAADGVRPAVVLEVSLRGRRLRMTRSPGWDRPKRRGSGTTTEQARVHLEERTGAGWQTLSTRLDETGHLVDGLLGLTLAQFCQVVLLPQGQFADFLRADAERRRTLLESLFDTGRFTTVERWLVARRQESTRALDEVDQRLAQVLARLAEAAGWVAALLEQARTARADSQTRAAAAEDRHEASAATLESATLVAEAHTRRTRLQARLAVLTAAAGEHQAAASVVEAARAVAPVVPLVAEVARLQVQLETARAAAAAAGTELAEVLPATGTYGVAFGSAAGSSVGSTRMPPPTELSSVARRRRDEVAQLRALGTVEAEADRLAAATDALQRRVVELDAQAERLAARLDSAPARRAELEAARDRSQAAVAALPGAVAARDLTTGRCEAAALRDRLDAERVALADVVRTHTDVAQAARQTWLDLRQARLDGMAAELAAGLVDGAGCPVCGSTEHPGPAEPGPGSIGLDDETAAAEALATAEDLRAAAADQLAALDTRRAAARAAAGGDETHEALRAARDAAVDTATGLAELAAAAESDAAALARFGEEHEGWVRQRVSLDQDAATLKAQVLADRDRLRALRATLDDARGTDPSIAARVARLARLADGLDALVRQVETVDRLEEQVAAALERAEQAARDRGLDSLEAVMTAARDDEVLHHLDEARRRHEADLASVTAQLAEPALSVLADAPAPDLHGLREQVRVSQAARAAATAVLSAASARVDALLRLGAGLRDVLAERAPMAEDHRTVDSLSRLAEARAATTGCG